MSRPLTNSDVDSYFGMSPCVCGDTAVWHPECYRARTPSQVLRDSAAVYRRLRKEIKEKRQP